MNRPILFRGFSKEHKRWIFGSLIQNPLHLHSQILETIGLSPSLIHPGGDVKVNKLNVITKSIGQWTGLYDSTKWEELTEEEQINYSENFNESWTGKMIFEGDLVKVNVTDREVLFLEVVFDRLEARFEFSDNRFALSALKTNTYEVVGNKYQVIGNNFGIKKN